MATLFEDLVARYKSTNIQFPELRAVTVAQWILESGRGGSRLASQHLNFAGLKWRDEMVGYAIPVQYQAHDGLDYYCAFGDLDAFIIGYWKFLSRDPYDGWESEAAKGPEEFIRFIGPIYNPAGEPYVQQVLGLVPEASRLLAEAPDVERPVTPVVPAGAPTVIVLDPGHGGRTKVGGSSPNNAISPSGELERDWVLDVARRTRASILTKAVGLGKNVSVIMTRERDVNIGLAARANVAKVNKAPLFLSIHFNASDAHNARGVETLIHPRNVNKAEDRAFAQAIQDHLLAAMRRIDPVESAKPRYDRKVKEQSLGVLTDVELGNTVGRHPCKACLVEIEFMDTAGVEKLFRLHSPNPADAAEAEANRQTIAEALADALLSQVG